MKRWIVFCLMAGILSVGRMESQARSAGGGRSFHGGGHGGYGSAGVKHGGGSIGYGFRSYSTRGIYYGSSYSRAYYRHRIFSPGFFSPFYWGDGYLEPYVEATLILPELVNGERPYYQKPPAPEIQPDCKDAWTRNSPSSAVSQIMYRMFEQQCENRHPAPAAPLKHPRSLMPPARESLPAPSAQD
ncbi:MAG: hypothetical protein U0V70_06850 [Terriglobia bacterium]